MLPSGAVRCGTAARSKVGLDISLRYLSIYLSMCIYIYIYRERERYIYFKAYLARRVLKLRVILFFT